MDHLRKWLEPDKLLAAPHHWEPGQEADIAAATLALFHLLPPQAAKFLETGVRARARRSCAGPPAPCSRGARYRVHACEAQARRAECSALARGARRMQGLRAPPKRLGRPRAQERPGLVVLTIELENALHTMTNHHQPTKLWSPYREPLALFLNKYTAEARLTGRQDVSIA